MNRLGTARRASPPCAHIRRVRERVLGPDHPDTVATRRAVEELARQGDGAGLEG
jgi:hypothetical protein